MGWLWATSAQCRPSGGLKLTWFNCISLSGKLLMQSFLVCTFTWSVPRNDTTMDHIWFRPSYGQRMNENCDSHRFRPVILSKVSYSGHLIVLQAGTCILWCLVEIIEWHKEVILNWKQTSCLPLAWSRLEAWEENRIKLCTETWC